MTAVDIANDRADTKATATVKPYRIPKRIQQAVRLIATGECKTQKAAAERVGIGEQHLCRMLAREQVRVFLARESSRTIAGASLRAANRLVELIDANSEHVAAQVSERILQSEGILKSDQRAIAVNVGIQAGFVLDLREGDASLTAHQRAIEAKPLIEHASVSQGPTDDD